MDDESLYIQKFNLKDEVRMNPAPVYPEGFQESNSYRECVELDLTGVIVKVDIETSGIPLYDVRWSDAPERRDPLLHCELKPAKQLKTLAARPGAS